MIKISSLILCFWVPYCIYSSQIRIVSLAPALTEIVCHLGGESSLVGRSSACDFPASIKSLPSAGRFGMPEIEKIVSLKPDWVIGNSLADNKAVKKLQQWSIGVDVAQISNMSDYIYWVRLIGKKLHKEDRAVQVEKEFLLGKKYLQTLEPLQLKVLWVVNARPLIVAGGGSLPDSVIKLIKAQNAAGSVQKDYFRCSMEFLAAADVDLIIWNVPSPVEKSNRSWQNLPAVKNKRIVHLGINDPIVRPGPRFISAVKELRKKVELCRKADK